MAAPSSGNLFGLILLRCAGQPENHAGLSPQPAGDNHAESALRDASLIESYRGVTTMKGKESNRHSADWEYNSAGYGEVVMKLKKLLSALLFAAMLACSTTTVLASSHSHSTSAKRSHKKNDRPKTVHVRSYKKKDGTVVKAHDRASPETK